MNNYKNAQFVLSLFCLIGVSSESLATPLPESHVRERRAVLLGKEGSDQSCLWSRGSTLKVKFMSAGDDAQKFQELDRSIKADFEKSLKAWNYPGAIRFSIVSDEEPADIRISIQNSVVSTAAIGSCGSNDQAEPTLVLSRRELMQPVGRNNKLLRLAGQSIGLLPEMFHPCKDALQCRTSKFREWTSEAIKAEQAKWSEQIQKEVSQKACPFPRSGPVRVHYTPLYRPEEATNEVARGMMSSYASRHRAMVDLVISRMNEARLGQGVGPFNEVVGSEPADIEIKMGFTGPQGYDLTCGQGNQILTLNQFGIVLDHLDRLAGQIVGMEVAAGPDSCAMDPECSSVASVNLKNAPADFKFNAVTFNQWDMTSAMNNTGRVTQNDRALVWMGYGTMPTPECHSSSSSMQLPEVAGTAALIAVLYHWMFR